MEAKDLTTAPTSHHNVGDIGGISLNGVTLNGVNLNGVNLNGVNLNGVNLNGVNLNGVNLNGVNLNGVNLNGVNLNGVNLNGINLSGIDLGAIDLNGIRLNGINVSGIDLPAGRLNGMSLNGVNLSAVQLGGISLNGVRLNGLSLGSINLVNAKLNGAALSSTQRDNLKLALSYITKCALATNQCVTATDVDGSGFAMCGQYGYDTTWDSDLPTSVINESMVTSCAEDIATYDSNHPGNSVSHTNQEVAYLKDFFTHAVYCALPSTTCVNMRDVDSSYVQMCGSQNLDPSWQLNPPTTGATAAAVSNCVAGQAASHGDSWSDYRERFETILKYATECALRSDQSISVTDWNNTTVSWTGSLGLADWWATSALNPAPSPKTAATGEELVSACLMARTNALGKTVSISIRARPELAPTVPEAAQYARHEGAFFGNVFSSTPVVQSCSASGGGWLWDPNSGAAVTSGRQCADGTSCGFQALGPCTSICNVKPGVNGETLFDDCSGNSNVVNTFLDSRTTFDINDGTKAYSTITGSTSDAPMVATGDFNGDGNIDLAIENNSTSVIVRLGSSTGTFGSDLTQNLGTGKHVRAVVAKDLNKDGKLDLVTANQDSLSVLLGNGDGTFASAVTYTVTNAAGANASVVVADFNNDGKLDLATNLTSGVGLFLGTGTGTFGSPSTISGASSQFSLTSGDFNGDGKIDLASASTTANTVSVLLGNGNGTFGTATSVTIGTSSAVARSLTAGDLNGDGRTDLAVAVSVDYKVRVLFGQTNGTFTSSDTAIAGSGDMTFVTAAFINNDTSRDLLVGRGSSVVALANSGTGTFTTADTISAGETVRFGVLGHFDRDVNWRLDLIASSDVGRLVQMNGQ